MWLQARSPGPAAGSFEQALVCIPASAVHKVFLSSPLLVSLRASYNFASPDPGRGGEMAIYVVRLCLQVIKLHIPVNGARPGPASSLPLDGQQQSFSWPRALSCERLGEYLPGFYELGRGACSTYTCQGLTCLVLWPGLAVLCNLCAALRVAVMLPQIHADIEDWRYAVCALCEVCAVFSKIAVYPVHLQDGCCIVTVLCST